MKKLSKLRAWLTLDEACDYLSLALGEDVQKKDIYRLALDDHLKLSVDFVNKAYGRLGEIILADEVEWFDYYYGSKERLDDFLKKIAHEYGVDSCTLEKFTKSVNIDNERFIDLDDSISKVEGVWDLSMLGSERLDIEHYFQITTGGPEVTLINLEGVFVEKDGVFCQLQERWEKNDYHLGSLANKESLEARIIEKQLSKADQKKIWDQYELDRANYLKNKKNKPISEDYYPAGALPDDGVLVVRMPALIDFMKKLDDETEKPLTSKERNTYLVLIAALCKEAEIDYTQRGISSAIQHLTESMSLS